MAENITLYDTLKLLRAISCFNSVVQKYYFDSCIWRDYFENRSDRFRPLGEWAFSLIKKIIENDELIIYSDLVEEELHEAYSEKEVENILSVIPKNILVKVLVSPEQLKEAIKFSRELKIPVKDALHAVLARANGAILVSRDKHFYEMEMHVAVKKPEELI